MKFSGTTADTAGTSADQSTQLEYGGAHAELPDDLHGLRVVAVHAHPDDEAIWTGGTLVELADRGAEVTVVTCTLGENGEVIGAPLAQLVADEADQLGGFRILELRNSLHILNVQGVFLGGCGRWRDSGMVGTPTAKHPRAFVQSGEVAVAQLDELFQQLRPHVVLTYGPDGGYGHPDHIRAHELVHSTTYRPQRVLWAVTSRDDVYLPLPATLPQGWRNAPDEIACVDPESIAVSVPLTTRTVARKLDAMAAHATQVWVADGRSSTTNPQQARIVAPTPVWALSNLIAQPLVPVEHYQLGEDNTSLGVTNSEGAQATTSRPLRSIVDGLDWAQ